MTALAWQCSICCLLLSMSTYCAKLAHLHRSIPFMWWSRCGELALDCLGQGLCTPSMGPGIGQWRPGCEALEGLLDGLLGCCILLQVREHASAAVVQATKGCVKLNGLLTAPSCHKSDLEVCQAANWVAKGTLRRAAACATYTSLPALQAAMSIAVACACCCRPAFAEV